MHHWCKEIAIWSIWLEWFNFLCKLYDRFYKYVEIEIFIMFLMKIIKIVNHLNLWWSKIRTNLSKQWSEKEHSQIKEHVHQTEGDFLGTISFWGFRSVMTCLSLFYNQYWLLIIYYIKEGSSLDFGYLLKILTK